MLSSSWGRARREDQAKKPIDWVPGADRRFIENCGRVEDFIDKNPLGDVDMLVLGLGITPRQGYGLLETLVRRNRIRTYILAMPGEEAMYLWALLPKK